MTQIVAVTELESIGKMYLISGKKKKKFWKKIKHFLDKKNSVVEKTFWKKVTGKRLQEFCFYIIYFTRNRYCPFRRQRTHPCYYGPVKGFQNWAVPVLWNK
jgi:hypothetical protein